MTVSGGLLSLSGCAFPGASTPPTTNPTTVNVAPVADVVDTAPQDAKRTVQQFFQLQIYQLDVPLGAISSNEVFWKPFDETFLGIWQHDVLYKNGIRVGKAPLTELKAIQNQLDSAERTDNQLVGTQAKDVAMELIRGVPTETLFAFDSEGRAEGHDFYNVDNLMMLSFKQVPRRPDRVRLDITPAVREHGQRIVMENDQPKWVQTKSLYAVGITLELGTDECVVISPSKVALDTSTSVGRVFMMEDRPAARVEKVLIIVPEIRRGVEEVKPIQAPSR